MDEKPDDKIDPNDVFWGLVAYAMVFAMLVFAIAMTYFGHMDHA